MSENEKQPQTAQSTLRLTVDAKNQIIGRLDQLSEDGHDFRKLCEYVFGLLEHPRPEWFDSSGLQQAMHAIDEHILLRLTGQPTGRPPADPVDQAMPAARGRRHVPETGTGQGAGETANFIVQSMAAADALIDRELLQSLIVWSDGIEKWREQVERRLDGMEPRLRSGSGTGIVAETEQPVKTEACCLHCSHAVHSGRQCPYEETQTVAALPGLTMDVCCRCTGGRVERLMALQYQCAFCPHLPHLPAACHQLRSGDAYQCQCGRLAAEMQKAERSDR